MIDCVICCVLYCPAPLIYLLCDLLPRTFFGVAGGADGGVAGGGVAGAGGGAGGAQGVAVRTFQVDFDLLQEVKVAAVVAAEEVLLSYVLGGAPRDTGSIYSTRATHTEARFKSWYWPGCFPI